MEREREKCLRKMTPSDLGLRRENIRDTTITIKIIAWRKKALVTKFPEENTFGLTIRRTAPELQEVRGVIKIYVLRPERR